VETTNPLNILLTINSIVTIGLILNQNESAKDAITTQNSNSSSNPFELATWVCLVIQLIILLIKFKIVEF
jgi:uncharacterized membrane protein